jgi:aspartate aminotransferase-like enzyme
MFETVLLRPGPLTTSLATRETILRDFERFYRGLAERGFLIYPGKLSRAKGFRIGCIGAIEPDFRRLLIAIREVVGEMKRLPTQEPAGSSP